MKEPASWIEIREPRLPGWEAWLLGAVVLLALLLRISLLAALPPGLESEEGRVGLVAYQRFIHPTLFGSAPADAPWDQQLFAQLAAVLFDLLGTSVFSLRLAAALIGTATVAALYLLARVLYGPPAAVAAAVLLATSRWHLRYSRSADPAILGPLLAVLALYLFYCCLSEDGWLRYALLGLAVGVSSYFLPALTAVLALLALLVAVRLAAQRQQAASRIRGFLLAGGVALLAAAPALLLHPEVADDLAPRSARSLDLRSLTEEVVRVYWTGDQKSAGEALGGAPLLSPIAATLAVLGLLWLLLRIRRQPESSLLPIAWLGAASMAAALSGPGALSSARLAALVPIALLGAAAIGALFHFAAKRSGVLGWLTLATPLLASAALDLRCYQRWARQPEVYAEFSGDMPEFVAYLRTLSADQSIYLSPYIYYTPNVRFLGLGADLKLLAGPPALTFKQRPKQDLVYVVDCEPLEAMVRELYPQARSIRNFSVWGEESGRFLLVYRDEVRAELTDAERVETVRLQRELVRLVRSRYQPWLWRTMSRDPEYLRQSLQPRSRSADLPMAETFLALGRQLIGAGEFERGRTNFEIATLLEPDSFDAHYALGVGSMLSGQLEEALAQWQECLRIDPRNQEARRQLQRTRTLTWLRAREPAEPPESTGQ